MPLHNLSNQFCKLNYFDLLIDLYLLILKLIKLIYNLRTYNNYSIRSRNSESCLSSTVSEWAKVYWLINTKNTEISHFSALICIVTRDITEEGLPESKILILIYRRRLIWRRSRSRREMYLTIRCSGQAQWNNRNIIQ